MYEIKAQVLVTGSVNTNFSPCPWNQLVGRRGKLLSRESLGEAQATEAAATELPWPTPAHLPSPRAQVRPLVKVLLPHVAAIQHKDIEDVDGTNLPLGLPLEGQVHCPPCQELAWGSLCPLWHAGLHSTHSRGKGRALNTGYFSHLPPS